MAPRGVSAQEKRKRMMDMFHDRADVFSFKEVEKIASKEKGIVAQSVKDVLQSLVDDGIVDTDKIGSGVYYWAFPSKSGQKRRARLDALNLDVEQKRLDRQRLTSERDRLLEGRQDTETRQSLLQRLSDLEQHSTKLRAQLCNLQGADPAEIDRLRNVAAACSCL
jgi:predicted transcriptional regulator